jgi:hypothetical protein
MALQQTSGGHERMRRGDRKKRCYFIDVAAVQWVHKTLFFSGNR